MNDAFETLLSIASDLYKDLYGSRPRHLYTEWRELTYVELEYVVEDLSHAINMEEEARRVDEEWEARMDFEQDRLDYLFEE